MRAALLHFPTEIGLSLAGQGICGAVNGQIVNTMLERLLLNLRELRPTSKHFCPLARIVQTRLKRSS